MRGQGVEVDSFEWKDDRTFVWKLRFTGVGDVAATFRGGTPREEFVEHFSVVADLTDFHMACTEASAKLGARLSGATEQLNKAARAFRQAQVKQQADLDDVSASEKMFNDLLFGALFAAAGGFAGGAVGLWAKKVNEGVFAKSDHVVDTFKDTAKFAVRSLDRLRGAGPPTTTGDSTATTRTDPTAKASGERTAAGENPIDFLTVLAEQVGREGRKVQTQLGDLIGKARAARDANSKADFGEDPVAIVDSGVDLHNIETIETREAFYGKGLWKTWLERYAYSVDMGAVVQPHVTRKLRKKILAAAKLCKEDGDDWIRDFGGVAKRKAEAESKEMRDQNWIPPGLP